MRICNLHGQDRCYFGYSQAADHGNRTNAKKRHQVDQTVASVRLHGCPSWTRRNDFRSVKVSSEHIILGPGRGFEIAQARLGVGRLHHCMRLIGMGNRALQLCLERVKSRHSFGKRYDEHQTIRFDIAQSRIELDAARLVVLDAAPDVRSGMNRKRAITLEGPRLLGQLCSSSGVWMT